MSDLVTVITPVHNGAATLSVALDSLKEQSYESWEALVVDDGSTDGTKDVLRRYESEDERIRAIIRPKSSGPNVARNVAITQASGSWIALLDADDWWAPDRLTRLLGLALHFSSDFIMDDVLRVDSPGDTKNGESLLRTRGLASEGVVVSRLTGEQFVVSDLGPFQPIVAKGLIDRSGAAFAEDVRHTGDFAYPLLALLHAENALVLHEALYFYRRSPGSLTRQTERWLVDSLRLTRRLHDELLQTGAPPGVVKALDRRAAKLRLQLAVRDARSGHRLRAGREVAGILGKRPGRAGLAELLRARLAQGNR